MYAKYTYTSGATLANIHSDLIAILTGEVNPGNLSTGCDQVNTSILNTATNAGWSLYDTVGTNAKCLSSPTVDGKTKYIVVKTAYLETDFTLTSNPPWSGYTLTNTNANAKGYSGCVFDGRYVYFAPCNNNGTYQGLVMRYDTYAPPVSTVGSWTVYDITAVNANSKGFQGCVYDGRYVYFVPNMTAAGTYSGQVTRYDTQGAGFTVSGSWSVYDTAANVQANSKGFINAVYDGRYVYFIPNTTSTGVNSGQVTRYDTQGAGFTNASAWAVYDVSNINIGCKGFYGAVFDGRYVYLVPFQNPSYSGLVAMYDTQGAGFTNASAWSVFDMTTVNANSKGFQGGVFDGRYVYFVPYSSSPGVYSGIVTIYDTQGDGFTNSSSYTAIDLTAFNAGFVGFNGAVFDGRYVYLAPYYSTSNGIAARYDTFELPTAASSWAAVNTYSGSPGGCQFQGGVFDGRYVYFSPMYYNRAMVEQYDTTGVSTTSYILELKTYESFDTSKHRGTNVTYASNNSVSYQLKLAVGTGGSIYISASARHMVLNSSAGNLTNTGPVGVFERTRKSLWDTTTNNYPPYCWISFGLCFTANTNNLYMPRTIDLNGLDAIGSSASAILTTPYGANNSASTGFFQSLATTVPGLNKALIHQFLPLSIINATNGFVGGDISSLCDVWLTTYGYGADKEEVSDGINTYVIWAVGSYRIAVRKG